MGGGGGRGGTCSDRQASFVTAPANCLCVPDGSNMQIDDVFLSVCLSISFYPPIPLPPPPHPIFIRKNPRICDGLPLRGSIVGR